MAAATGRKRPDDEARNRATKRRRRPSNHATLEEMIKGNANVQRYVEYQWNYNRDFLDFDHPQVIIDELNRTSSATTIPSNHTLWKSTTRALADVANYIPRDDKWDKIWGEKAKLPRLPTSAQLQALRYLEVGKGPMLPLQLVKKFIDAQLLWYVDGGSPSPFWEGARLDDPNFRDQYMLGAEITKPRTKAPDVSQLPELIRAVFPARPEGIDFYHFEPPFYGQGWPRRPTLAAPAGGAAGVSENREQTAAPEADRKTAAEAPSTGKSMGQDVAINLRSSSAQQQLGPAPPKSFGRPALPEPKRSLRSRKQELGMLSCEPLEDEEEEEANDIQEALRGSQLVVSKARSPISTLDISRFMTSAAEKLKQLDKLEAELKEKRPR